MAYVLARSTQKFIGSSKDTKPAPPNVPVDTGASALELDTGRTFVWTGTEWQYGITDIIRDDLLSQILEQLVIIKELSELRNEISM